MKRSLFGYWCFRLFERVEQGEGTSFGHVTYGIHLVVIFFFLPVFIALFSWLKSLHEFFSFSRITIAIIYMAICALISARYYVGRDYKWYERRYKNSFYPKYFKPWVSITICVLWIPVWIVMATLFGWIDYVGNL